MDGAWGLPLCVRARAPRIRLRCSLVHVYSLKNVGHPEYSLSTDSGVMCLDFHPHHHALLAVGCYDGTVRIHDVRKRDNKPIFASDIKSGKHSDPVWDIRWAQEPRGGGGSGAGGAAPEDAAALAAGGDSGGSSRDLTFYSVSSDGQVANWLVTKSELKMETVRAGQGRQMCRVQLPLNPPSTRRTRVS